MELTSFELATAPNGPIRGDIYLPSDARGAPVVLACHGFKGFKNWGFWPETARRVTGAGMGFIIFNFSGSGIGEDPERFTELDRFQDNTVGKELEDLAVVLDAVRRRRVPLADLDVRRLGLLGHSRGGGIVLARAGRDPGVGAVVTWAAVASFMTVDEEEKRRWRARGYREVVNQRTGQVLRLGVEYLNDLEANGEAYDPLRAVGRLRVPTLLLHGTRDEAVDVEDARRLARHAAPGTCELALIEGTGHTFGAVHPFTGCGSHLEQVLRRTVGWFRETLA
jgi:dipeptidyl aminopeptidase/acylaminoacyl peptidase